MGDHFIPRLEHKHERFNNSYKAVEKLNGAQMPHIGPVGEQTGFQPLMSLEVHDNKTPVIKVGITDPTVLGDLAEQHAQDGNYDQASKLAQDKADAEQAISTNLAALKVQQVEPPVSEIQTVIQAPKVIDHLTTVQVKQLDTVTPQDDTAKHDAPAGFSVDISQFKKDDYRPINFMRAPAMPRYNIIP